MIITISSSTSGGLSRRRPVAVAVDDAVRLRVAVAQPVAVPIAALAAAAARLVDNAIQSTTTVACIH